MPKLIVVSAPSGSGKTTIAHEILRRHPDLSFSVSATTRPKRENETHGKDYYFLSKQEFETALAEGKFVEHEELYQNLYGTLKSEIDRLFGLGKSILFDVDVKGALSIKRQYPDAVLIFIKPPSFEVLKERLESRKTEQPETLQRRLDRVPMELGMENEFTHQVVNDDLQSAITKVDAIVSEALGAVRA